MESFSDLRAPQLLALDLLEENQGQYLGLPANPRTIRDEKFELLKRNIQEHPEFLRYNALKVLPMDDGHYIIIGGNMRYKAMVELGMKECPCVVIDPKTPIEELKAYVILDNSPFGQWEWQMLQSEDWSADQLSDWGVECDFLSDDFFVDEEPDNGSLDDYKEPEKDYLECPHCHHVDSKVHFKKVASNSGQTLKRKRSKAMKIFLSAIDPYTLEELKRTNSEMLWNLLSYYQIRGKGKGGIDLFTETLKYSKQMLVDSGAHSFQKGKKVDWEAYTREYAEFIKRYDCDKIIGYFEMDVDNIIGYDNVLKLRRILTAVTPKIIPVWHKDRGIEDFKAMCREYAGRIVAITGFKDEDISDHQYHLFVKYAHDCGCKIHGLGMTRTKILDRVPFDFTDSASWKLSTAYGKVKGFDKRIARGLDTKTGWTKIWAHSYREFVKMQKHYHLKYHKLHKD